MTEDYDTGVQLGADPFQIARMFFAALQWHPDNMGEFELLMTPEALAADGTLDLAAALLRSLQQPQISTQPLQIEGYPHVAYVLVGQQDNATAPRQGTFDDMLFITLAWRPELGGWAVHHFGDMMHPQHVPCGT